MPRRAVSVGQQAAKSRPTRHEPRQEARIPRAVSLNEGGSNYLSWLSSFPRRLYPAYGASCPSRPPDSRCPGLSLLSSLFTSTPCTNSRARRVESTTGAVAVGRWGVAVSGGFRDAGASIHAMAPFPVAAHRTGRADFPHPALGRDHAFAHGRLALRCARWVRPRSLHRSSSGSRTNFPDRILCFRHSHRRSRWVACRSTAA